MTRQIAAASRHGRRDDGDVTASCDPGEMIGEQACAVRCPVGQRKPISKAGSLCTSECKHAIRADGLEQRGDVARRDGIMGPGAAILPRIAEIG